ncbi:MAG TPA: competence/damage-inducible protein A [Tissierellia bacterium]|nr:competence/damage-inducible protein A [Tissierellia bacterium]
MKLNLLEKTELWINNVVLNNVNLTDLSNKLADVLEIDHSKVFVVDVRETHITFDILERFIDAENFFGKKDKIFQELSKVEGFKLTEKSDIHSDGILNMINLNEEEVPNIINRMKQMTAEIQQNVSKRAIVFPTGFEVKKGYIKDTNTPYIAEKLKEHSYKVTFGEILDDDKEYIASKIYDAVLQGYGLIVLTGGVGAEDKDKTVEAILEIDPQASTPYIVKTKKGTGRHLKDGIRIGVGKVEQTLIVALPGPNDEVRIGIEKLIEALKSGLNKEETALLIADALSKRLIEKIHNC